MQGEQVTIIDEWVKDIVDYCVVLYEEGADADVLERILNAWWAYSCSVICWLEIHHELYTAEVDELINRRKKSYMPLKQVEDEIKEIWKRYWRSPPHRTKTSWIERRTICILVTHLKDQRVKRRYKKTAELLECLMYESPWNENNVKVFYSTHCRKRLKK